MGYFFTKLNKKKKKILPNIKMPYKKKMTYNRKKKSTYRSKRRWGVPRLPIVKADYSCMLRTTTPLVIANGTSGPTLGG
ncbi:hypothetical protein, partial [Shewanella sp.]|uniref:hypothetical protein n=1 Tax=Shewanella sp. TaxID=50422 RepID=UPI0040478B49